MDKLEPRIEIRVGSKSDIPKIAKAYETLDELAIPYTPRILSAHRTPGLMMSEARSLRENGFFACIAAAGGSAHLPGMTASETTIPVIGLPVKTPALSGQDSLYSIIQMPTGIPIGAVAPGAAREAAILAAQIAYHGDPVFRERMREYRHLPKATQGQSERPEVWVLYPQAMERPEQAAKTLERFEITTEYTRIPPHDFGQMADVCRLAEENGIDAIIAVGMLDGENTTNSFPGFISSHTVLPVIGVPMASGYAGSGNYMEGDIFRSMLGLSQPEEDYEGFVIAGMGINRIENAALYAAEIAALSRPRISFRLDHYKSGLEASSMRDDERIQALGVSAFIQKEK